MMSSIEDKPRYWSFWNIFSYILCNPVGMKWSLSSRLLERPRAKTKDIFTLPIIADPNPFGPNFQDVRQIPISNAKELVSDPSDAKSLNLAHAQPRVESLLSGMEFDWKAALESNQNINTLYQELFPQTEEPWIQVTQIEPDIYLGGIPYPRDDFPGERSTDKYTSPHGWLSELGVKTIVSFSDYKVQWNYGDEITFVHFVLPDYAHKMISECFGFAIQEMTAARERGDKIFIHCHMGYSRSVTTLIAFYLKTGIPNIEHPTLSDVVKFIKSKRSCIRPNIGFFAQLVEFESRLVNSRDGLAKGRREPNTEL